MLMQLWRPEFELDGINSDSWYRCYQLYHWLWGADCAVIVWEVFCCIKCNFVSQYHYMNPIYTDFLYPLWFVSFLGFMSFHLFQFCSNFIDPVAICWSFFNSSRYPMIPFILFIYQFSMYSFHKSLVPFSSTITLLNTPFRQFDPVLSCLSFTICFAIRKISFWCLGSFKSLINNYYYYYYTSTSSSIVINNPVCILFTLLVLIPYFCWDFFFSSFHTFSSFPLLLQQHPHSTAVFPCLHGPFDNSHMSCYFHHIIHLLPVFIYIKVLPLCFLYLISDHAFVFLTSFPLWVSIHTLLVWTSYAVFLLY